MVWGRKTGSIPVGTLVAVRGMSVGSTPTATVVCYYKENTMQTAYVIFEDSPSFWTAPFKKFFRHVSVVIPVTHNMYIHVDPRMRGMAFYLIPADKVTGIYDNTLYYDIAIVETCISTEFNNTHLPAVFTCVEVVKRVLGINKWWILTPNQLYKYLCK